MAIPENCPCEAVRKLEKVIERHEAQLAKLHYYIGVMITLSLWYYIHKISYSEYHKNVADVKAIMRQALGIEP